MAKFKRSARAVKNPHDENVFNFNRYVKQQQDRRVMLHPKSEKQKEYIDLLTNWEKMIVVATGPAGTGKTFLAVLAAIKALKDKEVEKVVVTRPAVGVENESHGFLPGTINDKMIPWTQPILDVFSDYYSQPDIAKMIEEKTLELAPLAFQRGRTFKDSFVIVDESQNMTINQMKMILTRLGDRSKIIVTGDLQQTDKQFSNKNGLFDFVTRANSYHSELFGLVEFSGEDIQRSKIVKEVLELYGDI